MKKSLLLLSVGIVAPFLFSCSKDKEAPFIDVEKITLDQTEATLKVGEEFTLHATIEPENATNKTCIWTVSNKDALGVLGGKVHAYSVPKDGQDVIVTVTDKALKASASCSVRVEPKDPEADVVANGVSISADKLDLVVETKATLTATVMPLGCKDRDIIWSTSNEEIVSLGEQIQPNAEAETLTGRKSSTCEINALALGTATITATNSDGSFFASTAINVINEPGVVHVESIKFTEKSLTVTQGSTVSTSLTVLPYDATNKNIIYTSTDTTIATVDENGIVTGIKESETPVTITATSEDGGLVDTCEVTVSHKYVNYIHYKLRDESSWKSSDMFLKDGSETEYFIDDIHFDKGDVFCFCVGKEWYKFNEVKGNNDAVNNGDFVQDGENIKVAKSGTYDIYIETDAENNPGIWFIEEELDPVVANAKIYAGGSKEPTSIISLNTVEGKDSEFYLANQTLASGDELIFEIDGQEFGYDVIKDGGVSSEFEAGESNRIKAKDSHEYTFYIETLYPDESGNLIYASAHYVKASDANGENWSSISMHLKEGSTTEYLIDGFGLAKGQEFVFNMDGTYYKYDDIKTSSPAYLYFSNKEGNICTEVSGTYKIYVETDSANNPGIYISLVSVDPSKFTYELLESGKQDPNAAVALNFKDGATDEFLVEGIELAAGDKIRFNIEGTYSELKTGCSDKVQKDSNGYIKCVTAGKFDIYVKFLGSDLGVWVTEHIEKVTYNLIGYPDWYLNDGASVYAWAWESGKTGHWYKGTPGTKLISFSIPSNCDYAIFVRTPTDIQNLDVWDGSVTVWNRTEQMNLSKTGGQVNPTNFDYKE